jgi:thioester reductase-like protein
VFRPGIVVGHSETGEMDKVDGPYYFFKLLQRLRRGLPEWFPLTGPQGGETNIVPVDFVARAMDHIAHLPDDELPGDTFHLVNPEPMKVGKALNEFAKAAHAPQFAMRIDQNMTNAIPKPVRAGLMALPTVKRIRDQTLHDLGIPPDAMENRDFLCKFDARDAQRALTGTGIAVPPLSTYAPRSCGTTGSATSTRSSSATVRSPPRSRAGASSSPAPRAASGSRPRSRSATPAARCS